jgi:AcrR family transcriptional regulator
MAVQQDLSHHAMLLLTEKDWDEVSAADIARAAGVSTRTFYRHFANKSDALWPILYEHMRTQHQAFIDSSGPDITTRAADAVTVSFSGTKGGIAAAHRTYRLLLSTEELAPVWLRASVDAEAGYASALQAAFPEIDEYVARLVAALIVTCVRVALLGWIDDAPRSLRGHVVRALERAKLDVRT